MSAAGLAAPGETLPMTRMLCSGWAIGRAAIGRRVV